MPFDRQRAMRLWVDALESGEYEQCQGTLERTDSEGGSARHCCLGVLERVVLENRSELGVDMGLETVLRADLEPVPATDFKSESSGLDMKSTYDATSVPERLGLDKGVWVDKDLVWVDKDLCNGYWEDAQDVLIGMNDSDGKTFLEIAEFVREKLID